MAASFSQIKGWLEIASGKPDITHMIVKCDTFEPADSCCYPVYVTEDQDVEEVNNENGDRTMEVYAMHLSIEDQLSEHRAMHLEGAS